MPFLWISHLLSIKYTSFFSLNAYSDNIHHLLKLATQQKVSIHDFRLDNYFFARIGFPLSIFESKIGDIELSITKNESNSNTIKATITNVNITTLPFDNILYEPSDIFKMPNVEFEITDFRLIILTPPNGDDFILVTSPKVIGNLSENKMGDIKIIQPQVYIGCTKIFEQNEININVKPNDSLVNFDININITKIDMIQQQFDSLVKLWKTFSSNYFISNSVSINLNNLNVKIGSESIIELINTKICLGKKFEISISDF